MNPLLQAEIDNLYTVFNAFPRPQKFSTCLGYRDKKVLDRFLNNSLKTIDEGFLVEYTDDIYQTGGHTEELSYLTPRILEYYLDSVGMLHNPWDFAMESLGQKFYKSQWWKWERPLSIALHDFFTVLWRVMIQETEFSEDQEKWQREAQIDKIEDWMCFLGNAMPDISPFLNDLFINPAILDIIYTLSEPKFSSWDCLCDLWGVDWHPNHKRLTNFLKSSEVENVLLQWWMKKETRG
jgi:hypothetical protein